MRVKRTDSGLAPDPLAAGRDRHSRGQPPTAGTVKRLLPVRVEPIPGEALESWLAALATRMDATWGELLDAVLPTGVNGVAATYRGAVLTTGLRDEERQAISAATGLGGTELDSMTLTGRYGAPLITTDRRTGRARTPWGLIYRQRYCPVCLKARPGRRKLEWFLPWMFVCVEHRCFLADSCPDCAQQQTVFYWFARRLYPHPERCDRLIRADTPSYRCTARLSRTHPDKLRQGHRVLTMQYRLTELLAAQTIDAGVYLRAPVSSEQLLIDLHVLGNWLVRTPHLIELMKLFGGHPTDREIGVWGRRLSLPPVPGQPGDHDAVIASTERIALNAPAAWVGAGVTAALSVLMQPSIDEAGQALRAAMPSVVTRELRSRRRKSGIVHSPAVTGVELKARAADFTVLQQLRFRTITELPRLPDTGRHAGVNAMLHVVPTLFWSEWAFRLGIEGLAWGTARQVMSRLLLTIGCTMAEHRMRRHLRSTVRIERLTRIADDLRGLPHWGSITTALLRLHEHLQADPPPIDYQRRRTLNYDKLLPEVQWIRLVADEGFRSAPTTATAARLWLTEQLSGAPVTTTPPLKWKGVCSDRMRGTLTRNLVKNLDAVSVEYLRSQGVSEEPTTWVPPLSLLDGVPLPGVPAEMIKPKKIHDLLATGLTIPAVARRLEVSVWKVRYQIEHHPMPARMAASRPPKKIKGRIELKAGERIWSQTQSSRCRPGVRTTMPY
jgi:hypothetical protein